MGLWKKICGLFQKKKEIEPDFDWEKIEYNHRGVNFEDEKLRRGYVEECLEQMEEASRELNQLRGEYNLVTAYLTDMEEIEALPEDSREEINQVANKLLLLDRERQKYLDKKDHMREAEYYQMYRQEDEVSEGIVKLRDAENYQKLIKKDLKRLDGERAAYAYRKGELYSFQMNLRGMAVIFVSALCACLVMLAVLQFGFAMNTYAGYFIAILSAAIAITVVCVKYIDAGRELESVEKTIGKLIQLQNKVKIRYANNTNLLEYLRMKYNADSAEILENRWNRYQEEKEARKQFAEAEAKTEFFQKELVKLLSRYRVSDPGRWVNQVKALLDQREMVEIRHSLILRRQALRQQMEYNQDIAKDAHDEIMAIAEEWPQWSDEIMEMVEKYDKNPGENA